MPVALGNAHLPNAAVGGPQTSLGGAAAQALQVGHDERNGSGHAPGHPPNGGQSPTGVA